MLGAYEMTRAAQMVSRNEIIPQNSEMTNYLKFKKRIYSCEHVCGEDSDYFRIVASDKINSLSNQLGAESTDMQVTEMISCIHIIFRNHFSF